LPLLVEGVALATALGVREDLRAGEGRLD